MRCRRFEHTLPENVGPPLLTTDRALERAGFSDLPSIPSPDILLREAGGTERGGSAVGLHAVGGRRAAEEEREDGFGEDFRSGRGEVRDS
jgi:hypothetical protein